MELVVVQQQTRLEPALGSAGLMRGEDFARFVVRVADREQVPRRALLGLAFAESGWRSDARRPTDPARDPQFWPDVSGGGFQQTVAFSEELHALRLDHRVYPGPAIVEQILSRYYEPEHAATVAARKLKALLARSDVRGDEFVALCRYNKPNAAASPGVQANYRNGLARADEFLAGISQQPTSEVIMDDALLDIWNAVRADLPFDDTLAIVSFWKGHWKELGSPVGPEHGGTDGSTYQAFSRGIVRWRPSVGAEML